MGIPKDGAFCPVHHSVDCCGRRRPVDIEELQAKLTEAEKEIEREHELFLVTHRENMKAVERIHELKTHLEAAEAKIAGLEKEINKMRGQK